MRERRTLPKETQLLVHELARLHQVDAGGHSQPGCAHCETFLRHSTELMISRLCQVVRFF